MIRLFLILSSVFGLVLYRYPAVSYTPPDHIEVHCVSFESETQYQTLIQESDKKSVFWSRGQKSELSQDFLYFVPPMGQGYFEYQKIGKEIAYYAKPDELFWKRKSASYPVTDLTGSWILLLSGDLTSVRLMDRNGNSASIAPLQGVLLVDYSFTTLQKDKLLEHWAAVMFSTGPLYLIRFEPGFQLYKLSLPKAKDFFAKSITISGNKIAVHLQQQDVDYIRTYSFNQEEATLKQIDSVKLPYVIPYRISMNFTTGHQLLLGSGDYVGQVIDDKLTWMSYNHNSETHISAPTELSVDFKGDTLVTESVSLAGGSNFGILFDSKFLPVAKIFRPKNQDKIIAYRLLPNSDGITIEDKDGYCRIRPSLSR